MNAPWRTRQPWLVAEIGVNHDGDARRACEMVGAAADAGFDAVKLQHWHLDELLAPGAPTARYQGLGRQRDLLRPLALTLDGLRRVRDEAARRDLAFLCTADGTGALEEVLTLEPAAVKIGSGDADNPWLLDAALTAGLPVLVSMGMATDPEVHWILGRLAPATELVVLHCVSVYPTPLADAALGRIRWLAEVTDRPVGFSDHTIGVPAAAAALALGAVVIEKHVTWNPHAPGPDHAASLPLRDAPVWVATIRDLTVALDRRIGPAEETANRRVVRKALHTRRALPAGHRLRTDDLLALRPLDDAVPAAARDAVVGRALRRALPAGAPLRPDDLGTTEIGSDGP